MTVEFIYVLNTGELFTYLQTWANNFDIIIEKADAKEDLSDVIDGVVLIHENHNVQKDMEELVASLDKNNCPGHRVDINGTLAATKSNFEMWVERNKTKRLLFVGKDDLVKSENFDRFFNSLIPHKQA
jgi:hypothetical protein